MYICICIVAVSPVRPRLEAQRQLGKLLAPLGQGLDPASVYGADQVAVRLLVVVLGLVEEAWTESDAARVREEVVDGDRTRQRLARLADGDLGEGRDVLGQRIRQTDRAPLQQAHEADHHHGLGLRVEAEEGVGPYYHYYDYCVYVLSLI